MAWNTPTTHVAGTVLTAATLNAQLRDNMKAIGDPWTSFTPSWTASTTNPAIGNGTISGAYLQAGQLVMFRISLVMGSTTTYGTGTWSLSLPVACIGSMRWNFDGTARDTSAGSFFPIRTFASGATLALGTDATTAGAAFRSVSSTVPLPWAQTDELYLHGVYEAA